MKSPLLPASQISPKYDLPLGLPQLVGGRRAVRAWQCLDLSRRLDCWPGSGRAGRELLPPQYTDRRDEALVPRMCKRGVTTELRPCMRLRSTLSQNNLYMGSNFLEQNHWLISSHLFISNRVSKRDRKTQKFVLSSCNLKTKKTHLM